MECVRSYDSDIHVVTERCQGYGTREEVYAEPTGRYGEYSVTHRCLIADANLEVPPDLQGDHFEEV